MNIVEIQNASTATFLPTTAQFQLWVDCALSDVKESYEVVIRIVDESESAELNLQYRHKNGATNILSFPFEVPDNIPMNLLGDLVICAPIVAQEAQAQKKPLENHWAHLVIHGILHLRGFDHQEEAEAEIMENQEITLLQHLNIPNPYQE